MGCNTDRPSAVGGVGAIIGQILGGGAGGGILMVIVGLIRQLTEK
ncbi:MAG: hypothetical protein ACR2OR_12245 [Hyphomicrobiales bacterium]